MGDFIGRMFGLSDNSELEALMRQNQRLATEASERANAAQLKAQEQAAAALVMPADSESARQAGEAIQRRRRKGAGVSPFDTGLGSVANLAAAPSYKLLMGS